MTILLTGATGAIGSRVLRRLIAAGEGVVVLTRDRERLGVIDPGITVIEADLATPVAVPTGIQIDTLVHAAACIDYDAPHDLLFAVNDGGAANAAALAIALGATRLIMLGTLASCPPGAGGVPPVIGSAAIPPSTTYGQSKLAGERAFATVARAAGLKAVVLRLGAVIGDGEAGFVRPMIEMLRAGDHTALHAAWDREEFWPVHMSDVVNAVMAAARFGGDGVYNITDGSRPTVGMLARQVAAVLRDHGLDVARPVAPAGSTPRNPNRAWAEPDGALKEWAWDARVTFPQAVIELMRARGFARQRGMRDVLQGPLNIALVNTPTETMKLSREMAGGLGFVHDSDDRFPPLDLLWLAARFEQLGWPVCVVDGSVVPFSVGDLLAQMARTGVDVVVCEVNLPTFETDLAFLRTLRDHCAARVVAKTQLTHAMFHERLLRDAGVDLVITGECDLTIDRVLSGEDVRGTVRLVHDAVVATPEARLEQLDNLLMPARHLLTQPWAYSYSLLPGRGFTTLQSSRGCPYSCGYYCPYPLTQGKAWRARSAQHVVDEIEQCVLLGLKNILFRDATFSLGRKRTLDICEEIVTRGLNISFWCETRINCLDDEVLKQLALAGCRGINFGLESGDDDVLKSGAKQGVDVARIRSILQATAQAGIVSHLLVVVGLPQETRKTIHGTYKLLAELPASTLGVTGITPFPDTPLWYEALQEDWIRTQDWARYGGNDTPMVTANLSTADIRFAAEMMLDFFRMTRPNSGATPAALAAHRARMEVWVEAGLADAAPVPATR